MKTRTTPIKIIHGILVALNILLALALLLTTVAPSVAPSVSLLPNLAAFAYPFLLAANLLMIILWLFLRRIWFLLSILAIVLRWSFVGLFFQLSSLAEPTPFANPPQTVSLLSFNVHQFQGRSNNPSLSDTLASEFLALVRQHSPDVLCLQEYASPSHLQLTDSLFLLGYNHYHSTSSSSRGLPYGTVVFSRIPIKYVSRIDNEKLLIDLLHDRTSLRICCVHMKSYQFNDSERQKMDQFGHGDIKSLSSNIIKKTGHTLLLHQKQWEQQLRPIVEECSLPLIVAGDFNEIPSSWLYSQLSLHLSDAYREQGLGIGTTFNGGFPPFRIDMIFHSDHFNTLSYRRLRSKISDHYPILATFEIKP